MGVQTCYCGPVLHRLECRLAKDKQEILRKLDTAHLRLDAKIDCLERKTQQQLAGLQRTVDSLGLESSAAGLQRVRNSIVLADPGHTTPPLPSLDFMSNSSGSHVSESHPPDTQQRQQHPSEVQYTLDKLGLDVADGTGGGKQMGLQALRNRLALTRIQEQKELDAIVEHYERRTGQHQHANGKEDPAEESEESEDDEEIPSPKVVLPPPPVLSSQKATTPMLSDSR